MRAALGALQVRAVATKELRQIARDRRSLAILLVVPIFFLLLYGYALSFDVTHVRLAVEDRDRTRASRELVTAFTSSEYFDLARAVDAPDEIDRLLIRGDVRAALVVPEGFARERRANRRGEVQILVDGDDANTAAAVLAYARAIAASRATVTAGPGARAEPLVYPEPRVWFNPELRTTMFLVPGLVAYIAMITAVISTALSLVREKERGTIEQIRMAPIGTWPFVLGKALPYFGLSLASASGILLIAMVLFDLPMRGSWLLLVVATALFLTGALGFGLLISTIAQSQQVAFQVALIASFLPTFILSGFIFPIASMPELVRAISYAVPARYYLIALRGIVLKGVGVDVLAPQLFALSAFACAVLVLAAIRLRHEWS